MAKKADRGYQMYEHKHRDQKGLFDFISDLLAGSSLELNVMLLYSQTDPTNCFEEWQPANFKIKAKYIHSREIAHMLLTKQGREPIHFLLIKHEKMPSVYYVISDCRRQEFKDIFIKFAEKYFPDIAKIFLTNDEMCSILSRLEKNGDKIIIKQATGKKRLEGSKKESIIRYRNMPYADVFDDIEREDQCVQSIRYMQDVQEDMGNVSAYTGTLTRDCYFSIKNNFNVLMRDIIPHALKLASERNRHLRASSDSASRPKPEPVVIKFKSGLFADPEKNDLYLDTIAAMPSCSISKYHTNSYIHISLVDYRDCSSYDLWAVTRDRLVIIPRFRASVASLGRLVNHMFEGMGEGKVEKFEEIPAAA